MPDRDIKTKLQIEAQVSAEFKSLEEAAVNSNPGIMDLLQVYGGFEAAVRQADAYLAGLAPVPIFLTTDKST
jgi:hypothetical protein